VMSASAGVLRPTRPVAVHDSVGGRTVPVTGDV
jgi:hypothetical protein